MRGVQVERVCKGRGRAVHGVGGQRREKVLGQLNNFHAHIANTFSICIRRRCIVCLIET